MRDEDEVNDDWKPIEGQLAKALPGQKINLRLELAEGETSADFEWILPGTVFRDFTGTKAAGHLNPIEASDLNQQEVYFYWADCGSKTVRVKYKVEGMNRESEVTIEVAKPTATLTATTTGNASVIGPRPDVNDISNLYVEEISFTGSVNTAAEFGPGGISSFVQLVTMNSSRRLDPSQDDPTDKLDGGTYYDGGDYPYYGNTFGVGVTGKTSDDPGIPLRTSLPVIEGYRMYTADYTFSMYLMFTPPGNASRQVPLLKLPWSWNDSAIYDDDAIDVTSPWKRAPDQREPAIEVGTSSEETVHPRWNDSSDNHKGWTN